MVSGLIFYSDNLGSNDDEVGARYFLTDTFLMDIFQTIQTFFQLINLLYTPTAEEYSGPQ